MGICENQFKFINDNCLKNLNLKGIKMLELGHDKNIIDEESLEVSPLCVSKNSSFKSSSELFAFGSIIVSLGFIAACYMIFPSMTTKMLYKQLAMEESDDYDDDSVGGTFGSDD